MSGSRLGGLRFCASGGEVTGGWSGGGKVDVVLVVVLVVVVAVVVPEGGGEVVGKAVEVVVAGVSLGSSSSWNASTGRCSGTLVWGIFLIDELTLKSSWSTGTRDALARRAVVMKVKAVMSKSRHRVGLRTTPLLMNGKKTVSDFQETATEGVNGDRKKKKKTALREECFVCSYYSYKLLFILFLMCFYNQKKIDAGVEETRGKKIAEGKSQPAR